MPEPDQGICETQEEKVLLMESEEIELPARSLTVPERLLTLSVTPVFASIRPWKVSTLEPSPAT